MEYYVAVVKFFQDGGLFMYPIMVVFAIGVVIAIERWAYLTMSRASSRKMWDELMPLIQKGKFPQAMSITAKSKTAMGRILNYGFTRATGSRRREDIETAMEEGLMEMVPRLEKRTHYLATYANIATLLGLLGTIIGLIRAFTAVAAANPADKAELLSASISVAMNTTAFGLIAAIPLLLVYAYLQSKTTELVDSLEMAAVRFLNVMSTTGSQPSGGNR